MKVMERERLKNAPSNNALKLTGHSHYHERRGSPAA